MGVGGQRLAPADLAPGKIRYPLYRRLDGPQGRSDWKGAENLALTEIRSPDHPTRSESLYWLRYPGHLKVSIPHKKTVKTYKITVMYQI